MVAVVVSASASILAVVLGFISTYLNTSAWSATVTTWNG
jgi:hypothetical protein